MRKHLSLVCGLIILMPALVCAAPVPVIFDTDMMGDVDDVGATAVLHALADRGEIEILATGISTANPACPLCLDALNRFYGRPDLPVGVIKGPAFDKKSRYADAIAREFPHRFKSADEVPDVVKVYRRALAGAKDGSVVLVTVGQLPNVSNLLKSKPDEISPLSGVDLVKQKVRTWVCMGGKFPEGREANIVNDAKAKHAIENWPGEILFSGWEIGKDIFTGAFYAQVQGPHPARRSYFLYNKFKGRESWDQTAVLFAARGLDGGLSDVWDLSSPGYFVLDENGTNTWKPDADGPHRYLIKKMEPKEVAGILKKLMLHDTKPMEKKAK